MREFQALNGLPDDVVYKEVVIVGNGPSGICMSYHLSGHWPVIKQDAIPHPDPMLQARLQMVPKGKPLTLKQLSELAEGLEGRSQNPIPLLVDCLMHPGADTGLDLPSIIEWVYYPEKQIDHVVLGKGKPGGSWHDLDSSVVTLSPARWMCLPGISTLLELNKDQRAPVSAVAKYYEQYVKQCSLQRFFKNNTLVTSVKPIRLLGKLECAGLGCPTSAAWCVCGYDTVSKQSFRYVCSKVILATGASDRPNILDNSEVDSSSSSDTIRTPQQLLNSLNLLEDEYGGKENVLPVLVIGSGLSAADAILKLRKNGIQVFHAYRGPSAALKSLPAALYPEYYQVHQMMKDGINGKYDCYTALPDVVLTEIVKAKKPSSGIQQSLQDRDKSVKPKTVKLLNTKTNDIVELKISMCIILIGTKPDLHFLPENFDYNYLTWNSNNDSLKQEMLAKINEWKEQAFKTNGDSKLYKHSSEVCIKCAYIKSKMDKQKAKAQDNGTGCFLKTQWHNLKHMVEQGLQKTMFEDRNKSQLFNNNNNNHIDDTLKPNSLEMQDSGIGLGIHPEKPIDSRTNPMCIDKDSHSVENAPLGMYALGPLTGDNFVRFIPGGALAIASHMWTDRKSHDRDDCPT